MAQIPVYDLRGPAGRLEALLDEPGLSAGAQPRAAVVFAHPHPQQGGTMHTKAVYRATKALSGHRLLGAAVQLSRRGHQRGPVGRGPRRTRRLSRRARIHGRALSRQRAVDRGILLRRLDRAHGRRPRQPGLGADRHCARHLDVRLLGAQGQHQAQVHHSRRAGRAVPAEGDVRSSTASCRNPRNWRSSTPPIISSTARCRRSATRSRTCWRISRRRPTDRGRACPAFGVGSQGVPSSQFLPSADLWRT